MIKQKEPVEELVMVRNKKEISEFLDLKEGFNPGTTEQMNNATNWRLAEFKPRSEMETNEDFLQIIPYIIISNSGNVFVYQRTKKSGEQRLMGKYSVGIGGHINSHDAGWIAGMNRELSEEVYVPVGYFNYQFSGFIFDNSTSVGKVHLGLVFIAEAPSGMKVIDDLKSEDSSILPVGFVSHEQLKKEVLENITDFEDWSKICINNALVDKKSN